MESLYHINFGPPLLGTGAQFLAPVKRVAPRDPRAAEGNMAGWDAYTGPHEPGYTEEVYLLELFGDPDAMTQAMLKRRTESVARFCPLAFANFPL
jgi:hypothetical protein